MVSFPRVLKKVHCSVSGFPAISYIVGRFQEHFMYQHYHYRMTLVQKGREMLPR